jgi:hypothetical protein
VLLGQATAQSPTSPPSILLAVDQLSGVAAPAPLAIASIATTQMDTELHKNLPLVFMAPILPSRFSDR